MIYTTGTVSTVSGSAIVSGTGTKWTVNNPAIRSGTIILIKNGNANFIYMVDRVNSDTELVISQPATFTVKNTSYSINLTEPNSYSDANNRMTAIASDTTYFLRAMDQWMMNNGVVTVELSNGQKVTLDSIKKMQEDIANKADLTVPADQTFKGVINASRVCAQHNDYYRYMLGVREGHPFLDYWNGERWTGEVLHPQKPGKMMLVGDYGVGSVALPTLTDFRKPLGSGFYNFNNNTLNKPAGIENNPFGTAITLQYDGDYNYQTLILGNYGRWMEIYRVTNGTPYSVQIMVSDMWTVDSNGFYKRASPIIDINPDGTFTTNDESDGAMVTRVAKGEYLIEGVLGFNSDAGWGGVDGGIEIPLDVNKQPLIWVDSDVMEDGSILVKTYHRTHPNAPEFANNKIDGYKDGDPIDIPDGRFISVRVQMPEQSIYNVRMREMEEAQKAEEELRQKEEEMKAQFGLGENDALL
ncbi:hypothetical protein PPN82_13705 [Proteus mirabilis]|uniref:phage tail fiber protein n=1 Tax=Proteus mirabilis TaxID=584 RepID=UPI00234A91A4|nr:hypothetical protein [Proteus mirabilis]MDC5892163.1 hypothetical protein [Proteus mirabilis]MDC5913301.1 hypothetical protein [Proteus mirabilis]MDC6005249.1 hypothetical protein [Proteus mirabilis]